MNLLQKCGLTHNIEDYAFIEYTTNSGSGVVAFVRHIGNTNFKSLKTKQIINSGRINFIKSLTDYASSDKQYVSDNKAQTIANQYYGDFRKDFLSYYNEKREEDKESYKVIPFMG